MFVNSSGPSIPLQEQTSYTPSKDSVRTLSTKRVTKPTSITSFSHNDNIIHDAQSQLSNGPSLLVVGPMEQNDSLFKQTYSKKLDSYTSRYSIPSEPYPFTATPLRDDTVETSIQPNTSSSKSSAASAHQKNTDIRCEETDHGCDCAISKRTSYVHEGYANIVSNQMIERMPNACIVQNYLEAGKSESVKKFTFDEYKSTPATHLKDSRSEIEQDTDCQTTECTIVSSNRRPSVPSYPSEGNTPYSCNRNYLPNNLDVEFNFPGCGKLEERRSTDSQFHTEQSIGSKSYNNDFTHSVPSNGSRLGSPAGSTGCNLSDCEVDRISRNKINKGNEQMMEFAGQSLRLYLLNHQVAVKQE